MLAMLRIFQRAPTSPISLLPPDILVQIFLLVCHAPSNQCLAINKVECWDGKARPFCKAPVKLSHVCSYWRWFAIGLPSIWTHIDLFPDSMLSTRTEIYMTRSKQLLLDVHIVVPGPLAQKEGHFHTNRDTVLQLLAAAAPRTRSLKIKSSYSNERITTFYDSVLATIFEHYTPGVLTELWIAPSTEIYLEDNPTVHALIDDGRLTESGIEAFWFPVTILRLHERCYNWSSKAFHDLTELRLTYWGSPGISNLIAIFKSSPQLRVFEIGEMLESLPEDHPLVPVRLENLEVLILATIRDYALGSVLGLIEPGQKPLSLSIMNPCESKLDFGSRRRLQSFIARSNIISLAVNRVNRYCELAEVLSLMPPIRTLAIFSSTCDFIPADITFSTGVTFHSLYINRCPYFPWDLVEKMVKEFAIQELKVWRRNFPVYEPGERVEEAFPKNLYKLVPVIRIIPDDEPDPFEEWCWAW